MLAPLARVEATDPRVVGGKAARLAAAMAAGFPVPDGFVVPVGDQVDDAELVTAAAVVAGRLAVRSSAVAEDLAGASFAGMYESYLDVPPAGVPDAVRRCRLSGGADRVTGYHGWHAEAGMAVLVQAMVAADAAGVAFTADPLTGARDVVLVTAVPGLAEDLVAGRTSGERWRVTGDRPTRIGTGGVLAADQAVAVADTARRLQELFGSPQDVEWAIAGGRVQVVQARPMTALPDPVTWTPPGPGLWACNFRLGEWLPDPVTPLFADWLLPVFDAGFRDAMRDTAGAEVGFPYGLVNGWYYATPNPAISEIPLAVIRSRGRLLRFMITTVVLPGWRPDRADRTLDRLYRDWRDRLLPDYRALAATDVDQVDPKTVPALVERVVRTAGYHFWYLAVVGGSAWKMEQVLRRFLDGHGLDGGDAAVLLTGLSRPRPTPSPHAVHSLDWFHPTAAEHSHPGGDRARPFPDDRAQLERRCSQRLADQPRAHARWAALVNLAQKYARVREEQADILTLAWPLLRACARRLGQALTDADVLDDPTLIFFLTRAELDHPEPSSATARRRREQWLRRRRLTPPLSIGAPPPLIGRHLVRTLNAGGGGRADGQIHGQPASPGRATGPARIVHDPEDFAKVAAGDVVIASTTTPAWTPLFNRAAAVVTDRGTAAAHAALIAREYGIPAVVATGDATTRITDGLTVTVDGGRGVVSFGQP